METFNSRMSEKAKSCIWMSMMYSVTAIALCLVLVLLSEKNIDNLVAFIACFIFMALTSCIRIYNTEYNITDGILNVKDFKSKSIKIAEIKKITLLKDKKRFTLNIPYDTIVEEKNGKKTCLAPENRNEMVGILKNINPEIIFD